MKLEDLPGELWFLILSYLTPLEAFYAFNSTTNSRIQSILLDMYSIKTDDDQTSSILNISLVQIPLYMFDFAISNFISFYSNILHSLTLSNERTPKQIENFLSKYSFKYDFTYLKCLYLIEPTNDEFNEIISNLPNLQTLSIQSKDMHLFERKTIQTILYFKSTIVNCYLSQFSFDYFLENSRQSLIKTLILQSCDYRCFISILNQFFLLKYLSIKHLSILRHESLSSNHLINQTIQLKHLKLQAFSVPFDYLYIVFPYFEHLQTFSLAIFCDEGYDYVHSEKWQFILMNYWLVLKKFQLYSEIWHLTSEDFDELYPQLLSFKTDLFWRKKQYDFQTDFYQDKTSLHLIFYSKPYPDMKFSNQWGNPIDIMFPTINSKYSLTNSNSYRYVHRLLLTIYNSKQMRYDLEKTSHFFSSVEILTIRFEQHTSSQLFGKYIEKLINLNTVRHLVLNDKCHTISTFYELVSRLPNLTKLTISSNHRILIKQILQKRNEFLLNLLTKRIVHLNLLYDGVILYETAEAIRYHFLSLKSFTACLAHFEDFRDIIPAFIRQMKSLEYLHIGLECDNDKKNFSTQDMYEWFRRHQVTRELKLHIDTYTNSIHIWL